MYWGEPLRMEKPAPPTASPHRQSTNWTTLAAITAVMMSVYSVVQPAAASFEANRADTQSMQAAIKALADHQVLQDERMNKQDDRISRTEDHITNIDKQTAVIAVRSEAMWSWVKSGGQTK